MLIRNRHWPRSLRRTGLASFVALMLVAPSQGLAQVLQSFEDLALRVNLHDQLQVEDRSGVKTTGRLTRLTRDEIAIQTKAGEKRFTRETVRAVAVRVTRSVRARSLGPGCSRSLARWRPAHTKGVETASSSEGSAPPRSAPASDSPSGHSRPGRELSIVSRRIALPFRARGA